MRENTPESALTSAISVNFCIFARYCHNRTVSSKSLIISTFSIYAVTYFLSQRYVEGHHNCESHDRAQRR